ncbi:Abi family protein [Sedimentibacter sp.]|uniref:Abi family protein n=1 Tax=Sedimentibacter sp. TaxID=1960295 RepID=UPI0028A08FF6|nr:Abi family protein [Sedimentibacter sp.]
MNHDQPIDLNKQAELMKKYVVFERKTRIKKLLIYTGYFRLSRYGKYLLSQSNIIKAKPNQDLLFEAYDFDVKLRKLFFDYVKKAEIQFKSHLVNGVSLKINDAVFYLDRQYYTPSKGENDKKKKESNRNFFNNNFFNNLKSQEKELRQNENKYPELKEYRNGGSRSRKKIPCWAAFSYFEFGTITNIYSFLKGDLRKSVLIYGYSKNNYGKEVTKHADTWLDAIRSLRNVCAHHNKLIGKTSSIVLPEFGEANILVTNTDLFSRMYALKKILNESDANQLKLDLDKLIKRAKFDVYLFDILPPDWQNRYNRINKL